MPRQEPDYRARVGGPGPMAERTDMQGSQPIRVPTGLGYGEAGQIRAAQQSMRLPEQTQGLVAPEAAAGSPAGAMAPQAAQGAPDLLQLLAHPTLRPEEPVTMGAGIAPNIRQQSLQDVIHGLEDLMHNSTTVPTSVMEIYQQLRQEAGR